MTNTGPSVLVGDVGVSPGTAITGFPPGLVTHGTLHMNDAVAVQAHADAANAYATLAGLSFLPANNLTGQDLGGLTLSPGVYHFDSSAQLTGTLTLTGLGQTAPLYVFQIGSTLTTASDSSMLLSNGADASNIFFQVGTSATLGARTALIGAIIAGASDTLVTGASVNGHVIALNGAVTLDSNSISYYSVPEASTAVMVVPVLVLLLSLRKVDKAGRPHLG